MQAGPVVEPAGLRAGPSRSQAGQNSEPAGHMAGPGRLQAGPAAEAAGLPAGPGRCHGRAWQGARCGDAAVTDGENRRREGRGERGKKLNRRGSHQGNRWRG